MSDRNLHALTADVQSGMLLSADEVSAAATHLVDAATDENSKVAFLAALAERGETEEEIAAFAAAFRRYAVDPGLSEWSGRAIDLCGTGGDHSGTVNISTAVAFVVAALGVPVIKHGNRSITSRSGSADVLEALGIRVERTPEQHRRVLASTGFTFLFAPVFHPAFRHIAPVRKRLAAEGKRSVFNLLGPLLNPARPAYQLLGVSRMELVRLIASALHRLEVQAGLVVCGSTDVENKGIDEATVCGPTLSRGCGRLLGVQTVWHADDFGATEAPLSALAGQGPIENARAIETVFTTCEPRAVAETIALNAALALWVAGRVSGPKAGYNAALEAMQNGQALATLRAVAAA